MNAMDWLTCTSPFLECPDCKPQGGVGQRVKQYMIMVGLELPGSMGVLQHACPACGYKSPSDERIEMIKEMFVSYQAEKRTASEKESV
jgi:hypothetical protein